MNSFMRSLLLVVTVLLMFVNILDHSLWTPDEPRVAEIAREMALTGDYLIPHLSGKPFLEKPPLFYAASGTFYRLLGTRYEGVGRFASLLFCLGTLLVVFIAARRLYTLETAVLATSVLATSFKFFEISHKMVVDNALLFFIAVALFSFILSYQQKIRSGYYWFWGSLACAFLAKGLVGIAVPITVLTLFALWQKDFKLFKDIRPVSGVLLIIAVMALWGAVLYNRGGLDYLKNFYFFNQFGRFLGGDSYHGGHVKPIYYYLTTVVADAAPWSLLFIAAVVTTRKIDVSSRFFYAWFFGGFILLSLSSTKRGLYLLPLYPALACITGNWMHAYNRATAPKWVYWLLRIIAGVVMLASLIAAAGYVWIGGPLWVSIMVSLLLGLLFWFLLGHSTMELPKAALLCWGLLLLLWSPFLIPQIDHLKSYRPFFSKAGEMIRSGTVIAYKVSESVEAFSSFYGGFYVDNYEDQEQFLEKIDDKSADYAMVFPKKLNYQLRSLLQSEGERCLQNSATPGQKEIELWELNKR